MSFRQEAIGLVRKMGCSSETFEICKETISDFCDYLRAENIQIRKIQHLKLKYIKGYAQWCLANGSNVSYEREADVSNVIPTE